MIMTCSNPKCYSAFQDRTYGLGKRVCNFAPKSNNGSGGYRCTVCTTINGTKATGLKDIVFITFQKSREDKSVEKE